MTRSVHTSEFRAVPAPRRFGSTPFRPRAVPALRWFGPALFLLLPSLGRAQTVWNSPRTLALVHAAVDRRNSQLADTGLVAYQATAHGYLTFLVQLGRGFPTPPKIVRTDQLALEVYWHAPNMSKQVIIGRRDTTLLPTDMVYHRDHLGIIQNNFPSIIRIGEGDEVRDAPHPLSSVGLPLYDYAISDSLRIAIPGQTIDVYEVKVRPKDDAQPRVVGSVYIDRHTAQVVRMAFSFTRAALLDPQLEDISIVLENGLIGTKYWLPSHQEIEIRRTGTWLDYPVRGIIRGRWEVSDYHLNEKIPVGMFNGPEFVQSPPQLLKAYPWHGNILDSLPPDVTVTTDADVRRVQAEARDLVREQALQRAEATRLSARGLSDFASVNRVQGLTLGAGVERPLAPYLTASVRPQYGVADAVVRGTAALDWEGPGGWGARLFAAHTLADARDEPERSRIANSLAAQEWGSDATQPYDVESLGADVTVPLAGVRWTLGMAQERQRAVAVRAQPAAGVYAPTILAAPLDPVHLSLRGERATPLTWSGFDVTASAQFDWLRAPAPSTCWGPGVGACLVSPSTVRRVSAVVDVAHDLGPIRALSHTDAAFAHGSGGFVPAQNLVYFGGPVTAPGYALDVLVGTRGVSQRVELQTPIPFFAFSLGSFGRAPATATLAPYFNVVALPASAALSQSLGNGVIREQRAFPSVGIGLISFFDLIRFDVARGLASGGRWTFSMDVTREFWPIL
jgi:hypothetical protein